MSLSASTQATLLLTAHFSKPVSGDAKPLGPVEWGRFALWMKDQGMSPEQLLSGTLETQLEGWSDKSITVDRIKQLLNRGSALAIAVEKWLRSGLWILSRSDSDYPKVLKQRLKMSSPPILFGCGNTHLLRKGGLAVVGSRNASTGDLDYATNLGVAAAEAGVSIVSGGAKGIDEAAMLGALGVEGTAVGILANDLLRASSSQKYRKYLAANNLVLISSYQPEAGFNAGNAMGRNKYIYCLSDAAVVVHSGKKGGTWTGAIENLKKRWVPLWVKPTEDGSAGNPGIVEQGGVWAPESADQIDISLLLKDPSKIDEVANNDDLFAPGRIEGDKGTSIPTAPSNTEDGDGASVGATEFYDLFLIKMKAVCSEGPQTPEHLEEFMGVKKAQLKVWLDRAVEEKRVEKLFRPVRYQLCKTDLQQSFF